MSAAPKATKPVTLRPWGGGAIDVIGGVEVGRPHCVHAIAALCTGWPHWGHVAGAMESWSLTRLGRSMRRRARSRTRVRFLVTWLPG
jgi:hypothetical protein